MTIRAPECVSLLRCQNTILRFLLHAVPFVLRRLVMMLDFGSMLASILTVYLVSIPGNFAAIPRFRPNGRSCAVPPPSEDLLSKHLYLQEHEPLENDLWNGSSLSDRHASHIMRRQAIMPTYTIDTYIHVVADSSSAQPTSSKYVTDLMLQNQFEYLAQAYTNASIG